MKRKSKFHWRGMSYALLTPVLTAFFLFSCDDHESKKSKPANVAAWETVVDATSFASTANFTAQWNYLYPWGSDHNGTARMRSQNMALSGGVSTISFRTTKSRLMHKCLPVVEHGLLSGSPVQRHGHRKATSWNSREIPHAGRIPQRVRTGQRCPGKIS